MAFVEHLAKQPLAAAAVVELIIAPVVVAAAAVDGDRFVLERSLRRHYSS